MFQPEGEKAGIENSRKLDVILSTRLGREKGAWLGHYLPQSREAVDVKALFLDRVDDESASVYENLNIKSPKVSGMSNTGR